MKSLFLLIAILMIGLASCKSSTSSDSPNTNVPDTARGRMSAQMELSFFTADTAWVEQPNSSQFVIFGKMDGGHSDSVVVILSLTGVKDTGTFFMTGDELDNQVGVVRQYSKVWATNLIGGGGYCHISKFDKTKHRVSGDFGFNVANTHDPNDWYNVSNGVFTDVKF